MSLRCSSACRPARSQRGRGAAGALKPGRNVLEVKVATSLNNYCRSLKDNPAAMHWTRKGRQKPDPTGLIGPSCLMPRAGAGRPGPRFAQLALALPLRRRRDRAAFGPFTSCTRFAVAGLKAATGRGR